MAALNDLFLNLQRWFVGLLARFLPDWLVMVISMLVVSVMLIVTALVIVLWLTWLERKIVGRIQDRYGANRAGFLPFGLLQPIADAVKFLTKEDIVPREADKVVHLLAPVLMLGASVMLLAVVPFGKGMIGADIDIGILYLVAMSSLSAIGLLMAGWGSNNKYSLLGGMRAVAMLLSYEIPMGLSIVVAVMLSKSLSMQRIVEAQGGWFGLRWFAFFFPVGTLAFLTYFVSALAEVNRSPFDIPEADSEIVAGYFIEYSGIKFGLFFFAEYVNAIVVSSVATTLFLGGWQGPILPPYVWFFLKVFALLFVMMWFRGTLPRLRIDQLMGLAWKVLVPVGLANVMLTGLGIAIFRALGWA